MASQNSTDKHMSKATLLLDIPPRLQWDHGNGFCGETCLQSIALYYGAWISQKLIRDVNKGEYLLQKLSDKDRRDPLRTLTIFHFKYDEWNWKHVCQPQFRNFCRWIKRSILNKHPVMFGIFIPNGDQDDYDHIVPAVGIRYQNKKEYDEDDELISYDLYSKKKIEKQLSENEYASTRHTMNKHKHRYDDCLPLNVDHGIAITGIIDEDHVTLPVHLSVSSWYEPNPVVGENSKDMDGTVTINNLAVDNVYALFRYSSYKDVPIRGDENAFLQSNFQDKHEFMATETTYVYKDPRKITPKGSVYYRCIRIP